jgi:LCP family protein required for cell wall assembly
MVWKRLFIGFIAAVAIASAIGAAAVFSLLGRYHIRPQTLYDAAISRRYDIRTTDGRTTILFLGIPGGDHDGNDLTDSMMLAVVDATGSGMRLVSLPRDLWSPSIQDKINSIYHYGERSEPGGGLPFTERTLSDLLGIPVDYAVTLDFSGFRRVIDTIGGIDVTVTASFTDEWYPIAGRENDGCGGDPDYRCRYKTVTFTKGVTHMDGETALTYVRSRHADSAQGSDFDRGRRQQEVMTAVGRRLRSPAFFTRPAMVSAALAAASDALDTDMGYETAAELAILVSRMHGGTIGHASIEPLLEESDQFNDRYVLVPKDAATFRQEIRTASGR